jgi:NAD(P)-dependent dehydrogenase (short-subunit alcohol dehydrogenase family)
MPVSVVTGATGGIGRWIALGLARAGYTVVLVGRDRAKGEATLAWIAARVADARLDLLITDLSLLAGARLAGMMIDARYPTVDVLVNNAGTFCTRREETEEGHERVLATNHLSAFVLTRTLLPALRAAAEAGTVSRIVNVGSSTSDRAKIDPDDLELRRDWSMVHSYSQSKLALMMQTFHWAQRLQGTGIVANVVHPGTVATQLVRARGAVGMAWKLMAPFVFTEEQGADTPLHAALAPEYASRTGIYIKRRKVARPNRLALDSALAEKVWQATETLAGG